jgi:hypothetical protein
MDVSIIIVNYNTCELTGKAIDSVVNTVRNHTYEIILVDNGSADGSVEAFRRRQDIVFIETGENLGFSKANNIGIRASKGRRILLLNSDTVARSGAIDRSMEYMDSTGVKVLGAKVVLPDGNLDKACKRSFPTPSNSVWHYMYLDRLFKGSKTFGAYNLTYLDEDEIGMVECIMGAYMMVDREVIDSVGLLDEDFFMYGEDIDWCYRMVEAGYGIIYYPEAVITHYKKASFNKRRKESIREFYDSMWIFYEKHYKEKYGKGVSLAMYAGIKGKMALDLAINSLKR